MKPLFYIAVLLALLSGCAATQAPANHPCKSAKDCVPDACCHAKGAVNKAHAPDCQGVVCSMNCEPGTLDCGQGEILCLKGACQVRIESKVEN